MKKCRKDNLKDLQAEWYEKLQIAKSDEYPDGFKDIEDTSNPDRPLKEWHSRRFRTERSRIRQEQQEQYDKQLSEFLNSNSIDEICSLIVQHGNSSISPKKVKKILDLHRNRISERNIAKKLRCGKKCVHITLKKAKTWMKVA